MGNTGGRGRKLPDDKLKEPTRVANTPREPTRGTVTLREPTGVRDSNRVFPFQWLRLLSWPFIYLFIYYAVYPSGKGGTKGASVVLPYLRAYLVYKYSL